MNEKIDSRAAEISEQVIAAYEATGWRPIPGDVGRPDKHAGCAIGVVCFARSPEQFSDKTLDSVYYWFRDRFGLDEEAFANGFDDGFDGFGPCEPFCDAHKTSYTLGHITGSNVSTWYAMKCIEETDERNTRDREALYA